MATADLILLHPPTYYDFRKRPGIYGPISDVVPSTPIFEMYPIGFASLSEYLERHGLKVRIINVALKMLK
ncbi:MAG: TIGR04190 family B12-binding domain/radical SAM domain protein, partial [Deltaproteobacteria bacterium]|nr:TIGR04190 family B12-binding domain/radical SAM domain protein [Deltaproteobacteria bacterium]